MVTQRELPRQPTSMGWLFFRASSSMARVKSLTANCVQISNSGKQWSTHRYSIHEAKPSFSHRCVHHSYTARNKTTVLVHGLGTNKVQPGAWKPAAIWLTIVTRLPNHWWASSCPTTSATHWRAADDELVGSMSRAVSLYVTRPQFSIAPTGNQWQWFHISEVSILCKDAARTTDSRRSWIPLYYCNVPAAKSAKAIRSIFGSG